MKFRTLGILWLICATLLFFVQEWILALVFGGLGVFAIFGIKEQPKKQPAPVKKSTPVKKPAPAREPVKNTGNRQSSLAQKQEAPVGAPAADAYAVRGSVDKYFLSLLQNSFPEYQVEQKVNPAALNTGASNATGWSCTCGVINTGKFCTECGRFKPAETGWTCVCGEHNTGKFCSDCGKPKPARKSAVSVPKDSEPLTFLLRQNGAPKVGIILCGKYQWDTVAIANTREACKKANIPCLRFMREFRNDAGYVTDRIRKALR